MTLCPIHNIAFGGEGVGRIDKLAVFVPFTLPGELVEVEVHQKKRNFARAKLQTILEKSPERVTPPCSYFGICGGCQLQHASYPLQLKIKRRFIKDSLERIAKINFPVPEVTPSSVELGYRRHISLKLKNCNDVLTLGFTTPDGSHLPITSCLLLSLESTSAQIIPFLQSTFSKIGPQFLLSESLIKIIKNKFDTYLITCSFSSSLSSSVVDQLKTSFSNHPLISGYIFKTPDESLEFGDTLPSFTHKDLIFSYSPFGFVQNHPEQSANIYDWIVKVNSESKKILDLYCGIGVSSLLLAKEGKEVLGIELNANSVDLAFKNAERNKIKTAHFLCSSAESSTRKQLDKFKPDAIVVNPPKMGVFPEVLADICRSTTDTITYISCNPTTLARDLSFLIDKGFILHDLQAFDMFPQTTHVETAVLLVRKKKPLI
jgi:23S rRNA (uracil1939-C5)-methyltransferase